MTRGRQASCHRLGLALVQPTVRSNMRKMGTGSSVVTVCSDERKAGQLAWTGAVKMHWVNEENKSNHYDPPSPSLPARQEQWVLQRQTPGRQSGSSAHPAL